jgi:hypothetical protein
MPFSESDLLSLELPQHYSNTYRKDAPLMAAALGRLQALYGPFSVIFGAGERARLTVDELDRATKKGPNKCGGFDDDSGGGQKRRKQQSAAFGTVLMFDRQMDLASVLLTGILSD